MRELDPALHSAPRVMIMGRLLVRGPMRFAALRDELGLTGGTLSTHLDVLERAGYVESRVGIVGLRPGRVVGATRRGRDAMLDYADALDALVGQIRRIGAEGAASEPS